jgi:YD repeat-containing protein
MRSAGLAVLATIAMCVGALAAAPAVAHDMPDPAGISSDQSAARHRALPAVVRDLPKEDGIFHRTFLAADGSRVARVFRTPVGYRAPDGEVRAIDNELIRSPRDGYAFRNRANGYVADLPADVGSPMRFAIDGHWVRVTLRGASSRGRASGPEARYPAALPGVDVLYEARSEGVKESLVLRDARAQSIFSYQLELSEGLEARADAHGRIDFLDGTDLVFSFQAPFLLDARGGHEGYSRAVSTALEGEGDELDLRVVVDDDWLQDPDRRFPVVLDPNITYPAPGQARVGQSLNDSYNSSDFPTRNYDFAPTIAAGYGPLGNTFAHYHHAFVQFDVENAVPRGSAVLASTLGLFNLTQTSTSPQPLHFHETTRAWQTILTWNTFDGTNAWTTPGGDFRSAAASGCVTPTVGTWAYWTDMHDVVQSWVDGSSANTGVLLHQCSGSPESEPPNAYEFASNNNDPSRFPFLEVWYEPRTGLLDEWGTETHEIDANTAVSVNVGNGNAIVEAADAGLGGTLPFQLTRYYNSLRAGTAGAFGKGGTGVGSDVKLRDINGAKVFYAPSGLVVPFRRQSGGTWASPLGEDFELVDRGAGKWTIQLHQTAEEFEIDGTRLTAVVDEDGDRFTLGYDANGGLLTIDDATGRRLDVVSDSQRRITQATERPSGRVWTYAYDASGRLATATSPAGTVTYGYDTSGKLSRVQVPGGAATTLAYTGEKVSKLTREPAGAAATAIEFFYEATRTGVYDARPPRTYYSFDRQLFVTDVQTRDNGSPELALSGSVKQLADSDDAAIGPAYSLTVNATDPSGPGVRSVEILVDGVQKDFVQQACTSGGCPLGRTWSLASDSYTDGDHEIEVRTVGQTGLWHVQTLQLQVTRVRPYQLAGAVQYDTRDLLPFGTAANAPGESPAPSRAATQITGAGTKMPIIFQDDGVLVRSLDFDPAGGYVRTAAEQTQANNVYRRMHDLGVTHIRFNVWWGSAEIGTGPSSRFRWRKYDAVINEAQANGFRVYLTLSGAADPAFRGFECFINENTGVEENPDGFGPSRGCTAMTGQAPSAAQYGRFVQEAVRHFRPMGITAYSLWNEPNLDRFLSLAGGPTPGGETAAVARRRADLFRRLYVVGERNARIGSAGSTPRARVFLGEFSEIALKTFFTRVVRNRRQEPARYRRGRGLFADGVSIHPYQHLGSPTVPTAGSDVFGINRITDINGFVSAAWRTRSRSTGRRRLLRTRDTQLRPQLFATEFGYFNRRLAGSTGGLTAPATAKLETERETLYPQAMSVALAEPTVRSWIVYQPSESRPTGRVTVAGDPACSLASYTSRGAIFDVGIFDNDTGAVRGDRDYDFHYGMQRSCSSILASSAGPIEDVQPRRAYCAIHAWTRTRGYPYRAVTGC